MRQPVEWEDAENALREVHEADYPFAMWVDVEKFVKDNMTLIQAAYQGGYEDALDDMTEEANTLCGEVDESLTYLEG